MGVAAGGHWLLGWQQRRAGYEKYSLDYHGPDDRVRYSDNILLAQNEKPFILDTTMAGGMMETELRLPSAAL